MAKADNTPKKQLPKQLEKYKWQKGKSGNINGRPPGTYSLVTILKKKLAEAVSKGGKEAGEELVELWLKKARTEKDFNALKEIVRYVDGMPKQSTDITSDGKPLSIQISQEVANKNAIDPGTINDSEGQA